MLKSNDTRCIVQNMFKKPVVHGLFQNSHTTFEYTASVASAMLQTENPVQ